MSEWCRVYTPVEPRQPTIHSSPSWRLILWRSSEAGKPIAPILSSCLLTLYTLLSEFVSDSVVTFRRSLLCRSPRDLVTPSRVRALGVERKTLSEGVKAAASVQSSSGTKKHLNKRLSLNCTEPKTYSEALGVANPLLVLGILVLVHAALL